MLAQVLLPPLVWSRTRACWRTRRSGRGATTTRSP